MLLTLTSWIDDLVRAITRIGGEDYVGCLWTSDQVVRGFFALVLVSVVSGAVGSLVVSNRMAFFSDALAHCAFSGIALGLLVALVRNVVIDDFRHWITLIMVTWGIGIGLLIACVQEKTLLPNDTVIGVFFAGALGLGAIFARALRERSVFSLESFIFGNPLAVFAEDLLWLLVLLLLTVVFLFFCYNPLLFGSFNPSLAQSRRVPSRLARYLFIVLLAVIVNLCQQTVGVLLINGLLIVPGATASYLSRNMRQLIWWSVGIALSCAIMGLWLSWEIDVHLHISMGVGGMVVVLSVVLFTLAMVVGPFVRGRG